MIALTVLSFFSLQLKAQDLPPDNSCPPFTENTEFCFENSNEFGDGCERTVCISYVPKPGAESALGNCTAPPTGAFCVTLQAGETGCINVPHPAGNISDWFDITFTIHTTVSSTLSEYLDPALDNSIENQSGTTLYEKGGCDPNHWTRLKTFDGRFFVITPAYLTGTGG
jgi:hypothetical protein